MRGSFTASKSVSKHYCIDQIQKYDNAITQNQSISNIPKAIKFVRIAWDQVPR